jgi:hypothetical protein
MRLIATVDAFAKRLAELGWIVGRTVANEYRGADARAEQIAAEFVKLRVDVIVTWASAPSLRQGRQQRLSRLLPSLSRATPWTCRRALVLDAEDCAARTCSNSSDRRYQRPFGPGKNSLVLPVIQ